MKSRDPFAQNQTANLMKSNLQRAANTWLLPIALVLLAPILVKAAFTRRRKRQMTQHPDQEPIASDEFRSDQLTEHSTATEFPIPIAAHVPFAGGYGPNATE
jgi:hypothetical protein